jgi:hypothetical protein
MVADTPQPVGMCEGARSISGQRGPEDYAGDTPTFAKASVDAAQNFLRKTITIPYQYNKLS